MTKIQLSVLLLSAGCFCLANAGAPAWASVNQIMRQISEQRQAKLLADLRRVVIGQAEKNTPSDQAITAPLLVNQKKAERIEKSFNYRKYTHIAKYLMQMPTERRLKVLPKLIAHMRRVSTSRSGKMTTTLAATPATTTKATMVSSTTTTLYQKVKQGFLRGLRTISRQLGLIETIPSTTTTTTITPTTRAKYSEGELVNPNTIVKRIRYERRMQLIPHLHRASIPIFALVQIDAAAITTVEAFATTDPTKPTATTPKIGKHKNLGSDMKVLRSHLRRVGILSVVHPGLVFV